MTAAVDAVRRRCRADDGSERSLRIALVEQLRRHVPFDAYAWLLTDPVTEVGSAPLAEVPSLADLPRLIRARYLAPTNRWTRLQQPVATQPDAAGEWWDLLSSYGVTDVATVVFRDQHGCWGWLDLWRIGAPFAATEVAELTAVAPVVAEALRRCQARTFLDAAPLPERSGPAVLVLTPELDVKAQTPETEAYLRALVPRDDDRRPVPAGAYNVAAQLLAVEADVDDHPPTARVHLFGGVWLTLRAARVEHDIAVTIEPSSPAERRELFARAHALTPREAALVDVLAEGADTRAVAAALHLSAHTVQDHLKSIFAKTGARNRRTLLSRLAGR